jgi:AcrR family transcriptional regulator
VKKDERADQILACAAKVFFARGYDRAGIRDVARACDMSLAGLYYHFRSKEDLLYRIQERVLTDLLAGARERLRGVADPAARIEAFIGNHLDYFLGNLTEMTVLSHEYHRLGGEEYRELASLRREYYGVARDIVAGILGSADAPVRVSVLGLFGMLNWLYTWYRPGADPGPADLAAQMTRTYLHGVLSSTPARAD